MTASLFTSPPPPGVACDCELECACADLDTCPHELDHWHTRYMGVECDVCLNTRISRDVHAYTRADAYTAILNIARAEGWTVRDDGHCTCPACATRPQP